jgi:molecular chaperone DnaK
MLEDIVMDLVDRTFGPVKQALTDAGLDKKDLNEIVMVGGMTRMPLVLRKVEEFFGKKPNISVNPDEVVAVGAAIQAGQFQGDLGKEILLLDVTPLSLGIETMGSVMTKLIEKNTTIPTSKSQVFSTAADNQPSVEIHVLQGERPMAGDNKSLGRFMLDGIPMAPRGVPQIEVKFDIDANGILHVSAKDKGTGKEQSIRIEASSGLSKDEIEKMKKEAEMHAAEDAKKRELLEARNIADTMIYTAEKMMKEAEEKKINVTEEEKKKVQDMLAKLKEVKDKDDVEVIKKTSDELSTAAQAIGMKMYQQGQQNGGQTPPPGDNGKKPEDEGPVEGEVVDDKK